MTAARMFLAELLESLSAEQTKPCLHMFTLDMFNPESKASRLSSLSGDPSVE